jgi:hypothetical protein
VPTVPVRLDLEVLKVAEYVNKALLSQPYTEVGPDWVDIAANPAETRSKGNGHNLQRYITIEGKKLHRPIHGLAHTMRTIAYSHLIHASAKMQENERQCKDGRTLSSLTPEQLKKINIAQLFFVAGRRSEASYGDAYHRYHLYGAQLFANYASKHLQHLFTPEEIRLYARAIEDREGDGWDVNPETHMMHLCHMVDLMRCKSPVEVFMGHSEGVSGIVPTLIKMFGKAHGLGIMHYARSLFASMGEGVPYISSREWPELGASLRKVKYAQRVVGKLEVKGVEADVARTAKAGFSVAGCYEAIAEVDTPVWYHFSLEQNEIERSISSGRETKELKKNNDEREVREEVGTTQNAQLKLEEEPIPNNSVYNFFKPLINIFKSAPKVNDEDDNTPTQGN